MSTPSPPSPNVGPGPSTGRLAGKVAVITGAAAGMGRVALGRFAAEGARVVGLDVAEPDEAVHEATEAGGEALGLVADVTDDEAVGAAMREAVHRFGTIDVLYNNAGVSLGDDEGPETTSESTWDATLAVNVKGMWRCTRAALPALRDGGGSIINVASFVALMGAATPQLAYTSSKGAVVAMTREIAVEHAADGIRANALCPGPVMTPLLAQYMSDDAERHRRLVHVPMGRFGEAHEMVAGAVFLASDESSFMTGQSLVIDGGITAAYTTPG